MIPADLVRGPPKRFMTDQSPTETLNALRVGIDRIDAAMHDLLIERGGLIEELIAVKARQGGGSAFRPGRESEMMRRIAERHRGPLPLDTVESIWRIIIATFTFVQARYAVHADIGSGDAAVRDSARFHFGFTVPLQVQASARNVVEAVARAEGDLGLVPVATDSRWWLDLVPADAPKIIARLPFVERDDHPAGLPVFVLARPTAAAAVRDVVLYAISGRTLAWIEDAGGSVVGGTGQQAGASCLVAVEERDAPRFVAAGERWADAPAMHEVGSHAARFSLDRAS